ncbi:negative regulation of growth hormone receptor signaling pathway [Branchiostoma belcheri]|nr:negative regulation of growth hormone receptor signaling pathway [Branchiostoma belcheri]
MLCRWWIFLTCFSASLSVAATECCGKGAQNRRARAPRATSRDQNLRDARLLAIQKVILKQLGYRRPPNVTRSQVTEAEKKKMLRLYEMSVEETSESRESVEQEELATAKTFHSFPATGGPPVQVSTEDWEDGLHKVRLYFQLDFPQTHHRHRHRRVANAKLKLYKSEIFPENLLRSTDGLVTLSFYQLLEPPRTGKTTLKRLIESRTTSVLQTGWEKVDVTAAVQSWMTSPEKNYGIEVVCEHEPLDDVMTFYGTDRDSDVRRPAETDDPDVLAPRLIVLTQEVKSSQREKRSYEPEDCQVDDGETRCCRYPLYVNFTEIGWGDWIVAPEGFNVFYCNGTCPYRYKSANEHSLIKSTLHHLNPDSPQPCCVAKRLSPLSVLNYDDSDPPQLIVTPLNNIVVDQCACT